VGKRIEPVPLSAKSDEIALAMRPEHQTVYYELAAE
jgi:hypothetical protein